MTDPSPARQEGSAHEFNQLAPFIQEFIWKNKWTELHDIQVRTTRAVFDTKKHILLASGTASGKTEAAFLPILTQLYNDPPSAVGALYIGPLKALINDQFLRLNDLCAEAGISVTAWHGDVTAARKHALLRHPQGILQITPEALEGLLLNHSGQLAGMFGDLRWIVIDEIHAFMASDRGGQVLALLDRLARYALDKARLPRRAGLSATLGDYTEAAAWLAGSSTCGVEVIADPGRRTAYLLVDQFTTNPLDLHDEEATPVVNTSVTPVDGDRAASDTGSAADELLASEPEFFDAALDATQRRKSIIFVNKRSDAEEVVVGLRRLCERRQLPDIYHIHHGSIAASLREEAEIAMRDAARPACTAATITLELGIDLGQLDRVLQLGPTHTVSSFLQRLGRCGRRGQRSEMFFLLREERADQNDSMLERIPWDLLQTIALIQLYAEEKWVEPLSRSRLPGSLLYHQTMSVVGAAGELTPPELAERVLTLAPFRNVSLEDFRMLLLHLLSIDHLERTEEGGLMLGLDGERIVRNFRFLATFQDTAEWSVKSAGRDIGTVTEPVAVGERFLLAGRTWEVIETVVEQRLLIVRRIPGRLRAHFAGRRVGEIHDRVAERMQRVLTEDLEYPYLSNRAAARLKAGRDVARAAGIALRPCMVRVKDQSVALVPWCGTRKLRTMALRLSQVDGVSVIVHPFYIEVTYQREDAEREYVRSDDSDNSGYAASRGDHPDAEDVAERMSALMTESWDGSAMVALLDRVRCERGKYDPFLPEDLLRREFADTYLDAAGAAAAFARTVSVQ